MPVAVRRGTQQRDGIEPSIPAPLPSDGGCMGAPSVSLTLGAGSKKISMNLTENLERERVGGNYPQRLEGRLDGCYSVALYETGHKGRPLNRPYQIIW